jgi:hypothetical protein
MVAAMFQVPAVPKWLWGDWLNTAIGGNDPLYMFLAEGPICCAGVVGLMIIIVGVVLAIGGMGEDDEYYAEEEIV